MNNRQHNELATISATGTAVSGPCLPTLLHLAAGADAATATVRDGGVNGPIRAKLAAVATGNDSILLPDGAYFTTDMHVTLTGTSPSFTVAIPNPKSSQLNPS
jgi:hypothetical protein